MTADAHSINRKSPDVDTEYGTFGKWFSFLVLGLLVAIFTWSIPTVGPIVAVAWFFIFLTIPSGSEVLGCLALGTLLALALWLIPLAGPYLALLVFSLSCVLTIFLFVPKAGKRGKTRAERADELEEWTRKVRQAKSDSDTQLRELK
ncbi:membrane protein implicated in regulation of membrane protease activity [Arthrobacter woluwensis]|uniref:hypothetical protein n=1 Tax=Arthrobacter woluwensis TaxID=156980 RepID=UPI0027843275|nr:hypothetical protein [Arthrobacter woluwensis]MDQ0708900.1 membrane protein implicated in regulation of membrane protease activity [Arthrobacter woluwensis]